MNKALVKTFHVPVRGYVVMELLSISPFEDWCRIKYGNTIYVKHKDNLIPVNKRAKKMLNRKRKWRKI